MYLKPKIKKSLMSENWILVLWLAVWDWGMLLLLGSKRLERSSRRKIMKSYLIITSKSNSPRIKNRKAKEGDSLKLRN